MKHISIGILIIITLFIMSSLFVNFGIQLYSEVYLLSISIIASIFNIKYSKSKIMQKDILKVSLFVAIFLAVPPFFIFADHTQSTIGSLLLQASKIVSFFIANYVGMIIPLKIYNPKSLRGRS